MRAGLTLVGGAASFGLIVVGTRIRAEFSPPPPPGSLGPGLCGCWTAPVLGVLVASAVLWLVAGRHRKERGRCEYCGFRRSDEHADYCRTCGR
jgi:hypothetical protein